MTSDRLIPCGWQAHRFSRITARRLTVAFVALLAAGYGYAQEGYPLDGTWRGEWASGGGEPTPVVITMKWDGEQLNGMINPGPKSIPFSSATLDADSWTVHIQAETADSMPIEIEGQLQEIGSYNRFITGTWTQDHTEHGFKITRE